MATLKSLLADRTISSTVDFRNNDNAASDGTLWANAWVEGKAGKLICIGATVDTLTKLQANPDMETLMLTALVPTVDKSTGLEYDMCQLAIARVDFNYRDYQNINYKYMTKTTLTVKNQSLSKIENANVQVGIVSGLKNGIHSHEYQVFNLKMSIPNLGLIGVNSNDVFAIQFKFTCEGDYAFAVYLDGINISQSGGIHSLNEIFEDQRSIYKMHKGVLVLRDAKKDSKAYINRFNQINGENRLFTFTTDENSGVNEILINDVSLSNKIEVYVWKETVEEEDYMLGEAMISNSSPSTKVGAGDATHESYKQGTHLLDPEFLGKVTFIHTHFSKVSHLGKTLLPTNQLLDPMNKVPRT